MPRPTYPPRTALIRHEALDDLEELGAVGRARHGLAKGAGVGQADEVPAGELAHLDRSPWIAFAGDHGGVVRKQHALLLGQRRGRRGLQAAQRRTDFAEHPGTGQRAARHHHAGRPTDRQRALCRRRIDDVPVGDDRDLHRIDHLADQLPLRRLAVMLVGRPAVDGDRRRAVRLDAARHVDGGPDRERRPQADLGGHRNPVRPGHSRAHEAPDRRRITQQARAGRMLSHDALFRTAEVQIDDRHAQIRQSSGGLTDHVRLAVPELHPERSRLVRHAHESCRRGVAVHPATSPHHFGEGQAAAAELPHDAAEDGVGETGNRRRQHRRVDVQGIEVKGIHARHHRVG